MYLNVDLLGDIGLTQNPIEDSIFIIEPYSYEEDLSDGSIVRIKHWKSNKYISLEEKGGMMEMTSEARLIDTFFLNKVQVNDLRLTIFINDAHKVLKKELL